jgi:DNA helicase II / ATP-dependent DNA helicase PcrA
MSWNTGLTGKALAIAEIDTKHLRVMAGPGTGKTFAMKRRVARLLEQKVDPERILAITFTRVAAAILVKELKELNIDGCGKIRAGTLHSFCLQLLNRQDVFEFSGRVPRPLVTFSKAGVLQFEAAPMLEDIRLDGKREDTKRVRAFDAAWARLQSEAPGWPVDPKDRAFHDALVGWLVFHRAILIGELVPQVLKYLKSNPQSADLTAFDHVIVDEYQDLNRGIRYCLITFRQATRSSSATRTSLSIGFVMLTHKGLRSMPQNTRERSTKT